MKNYLLGMTLGVLVVFVWQGTNVDKRNYQRAINHFKQVEHDFKIREEKQEITENENMILREYLDIQGINADSLLKKEGIDLNPSVDKQQFNVDSLSKKYDDWVDSSLKKPHIDIS